MTRRFLYALPMTVFLLSGGMARTQAATEGNPETNASDRNYDASQPKTVGGAIQKTEDGANRGLNHVDAGVHKIIRKSKKGAHKAKKHANHALDSVDQSIHEKN